MNGNFVPGEILDGNGVCFQFYKLKKGLKFDGGKGHGKEEGKQRQCAYNKMESFCQSQGFDRLAILMHEGEWNLLQVICPHCCMFPVTRSVCASKLRLSCLSPVLILAPI